MNIVLIGHEGYVGRSVHAYLARRHRVFGWDKQENLFNLDAAWLARENIEVLINLSVMADRQSKSFQVGSPTDEVNVMGARHLARILSGSQIAWFQFSTREVFGPVYGPRDVTKTKAGYRPRFLVEESFPFAPVNPYGKSKLMAEFIAESHPYSAVIRMTTCYTDYDCATPSWVVNLVRTVVQGQPVTLTRGGEQFRDPLHSDDLCRLLEHIWERKLFGESFHAGGGRKNLLSLKEFVRLVDPKVTIHKAPGGDYGFAFDVGKAKRLAGWEPTVLIRERIAVVAANVRAGCSRPPMLA